MRSAFLNGAGYAVAGAALLSATSATADEAAPSDGAAGDGRIVVTANRQVIEALQGVSPEREYDETEVASYGASTVGDVVDEVRTQNGDDDDPVYLVNGQPVTDIDDVADLPAEAVERLEVLPRGSGQKIGRRGDRHVYNLVLKKQLRSATLSAGGSWATEGGWGELSGETILSHIAGPQRINLTLRARDSDALTEADRGLVQPDPATVNPPADYYEPVAAGTFRTLRGPTRSYQASLIAGSPLAAGITASASLVGRISRTRSLSGLPDILFVLPGESPSSPTGTDQRLLLFGSDPLHNRSETRSLSGNAMVSAVLGDWMAMVTGRFSLNDQRFRNERLDIGLLAQPIAVPDGRDPYTDAMDDFFQTGFDRARSDQRSWLARLDAGGPLLHLPPGDLRVRGSLERDGDRSHDTADRAHVSTERVYERTGTLLTGGIDIPLAGKDFLRPLGELTLSLDRSHHAFDRLPDLGESSATALWQPNQRVSVTAYVGKRREMPSIDVLADPVVTYENVRTFDFLTGETVDVTVVTGGNPALRPFKTRTHRLSLSVAPWQRHNLQLSADYEGNRVHGLVSSVPPASAQVFDAFPERFVRDASGRLVLVDSRPVNFDREDSRQLHYGISFFVPLGPPPAAAGGGQPGPAAPRWRLDVNFSHTIALKDEIVIRPGLPPVDLLGGGAVGIGGGRPRHFVTGSLAVTRAGSGVRLSGLYRSESSLVSGTAAAPERLRFAPIFTASLRAYAELGPLLPETEWLKDTRLSLTADNLGNHRQRVRDDAGLTPLRYQSAYLDPVGRTVMVELRKVF